MAYTPFTPRKHTKTTYPNTKTSYKNNLFAVLYNYKPLNNKKTEPSLKHIALSILHLKNHNYTLLIQFE